MTASLHPRPRSPPRLRSVREIIIAHRPDSDDAFMFYGLATNKVRVPGLKFTPHALTDIETLNQKAIDEAFYDVTAISFHAYPYLQDNYTLMACGGSRGRRLRPDDRREPTFHARRDQKAVRIAVPGELTTAVSLAQALCARDRNGGRPLRSDHSAVLAGNFEAGLIIHEGQLTYSTTACTRCSIWASGGARRPGCRCPWAAMRSAARWAKNDADRHAGAA